MSTAGSEGKKTVENEEIPEGQLWTLQEPHRSAIERGMAWAAENPPAETDLAELLLERTQRTEAKRPRGASR